MATIQNITIDQDADYTETLTVKDSTGTVVDLSSLTITASMRKNHLSVTKTDFTTATVSATDGTCTITLTDTVTAALNEGRYVWDLVTATSGGIKTRRIEGQVTITPSVTRQIMANQSTQKYIDGEKDWITAMLASTPVVEGQSPDQVE